jgi:hypothetical protein
VTFPARTGDWDCNDPPPTITWTPEVYDRFRVFISWVPLFSGTKKVSSGDKLLRTTSWTVPQKKWNKVCSNANPNLYFRVYGKSSVTGRAELSETATVQVK